MSDLASLGTRRVRQRVCGVRGVRGVCFRVSSGEILPGMCSHMQSDE